MMMSPIRREHRSIELHHVRRAHRTWSTLVSVPVGVSNLLTTLNHVLVVSRIVLNACPIANDQISAETSHKIACNTTSSMETLLRVCDVLH